MSERDDNLAGIEMMFCPFIKRTVPVAVGETIVSTDGWENSVVRYGICYVCECSLKRRRMISAEKRWRRCFEVVNCR